MGYYYIKTDYLEHSSWSKNVGGGIYVETEAGSSSKPKKKKKKSVTKLSSGKTVTWD